MVTGEVVWIGAFEAGPRFIRDDNVPRIFPAANQTFLSATSWPREWKERLVLARNIRPRAFRIANYLRFDPRGLRVGRPRPKYATDISPQLTAFFTSALILASSVAVNPFSAKATGHKAPSSRCAASLKPNVAYLVLNFCAGWKKQTTSPSLAYAGIPYQVLGERAGALALMIAWSRLPMARSGSRISAIFASTALSPSALSACGPRPADVFSSWTRSFIAARSSSMNPVNFLLIAVVLLADFCVSFFGLIETSFDSD